MLKVQLISALSLAVLDALIGRGVRMILPTERQRGRVGKGAVVADGVHELAK